ncbi:Protein-arginine kinase [bioreactor metagenome]|uniref:Protein-arginine kinase n=1 Tax=bioreactor metagenome TaxID=1076179 RepID=A0A644Z7I5_9ZZZZ|nr:protein arginine kinase [Candidatus Metalachnospira sp.]
MSKWYESEKCNKGIIISSRVRLARNLKKYNFYNKLSSNDAEKMIQEVKSSMLDSRTVFGEQFKYIPVNTMNDNLKFSLVEKHVISPEFMRNNKPCGVLVKDDETISIMINEEDHIRIQAISPGDNIGEAFDLADKIDNLIEESVEYAFSEKYGYLTSCPTNVGTGLRASYMMHLPQLEKTGQMRSLVQAISKFGITVRGIYGEGSDAMGSIYQVSNQVTLGQSEHDIIDNLKRVAATIVQREAELEKNEYKEASDDIEDRVWRSYGILKTARKISGKEAMHLFSNIMEGKNMGVAGLPKLKVQLVELMINIQPASIQVSHKTDMTPLERDKYRAEYIRNTIE